MLSEKKNYSRVVLNRPFVYVFKFNLSQHDILKISRGRDLIRSVQFSHLREKKKNSAELYQNDAISVDDQTSPDFRVRGFSDELHGL